MSTKTTLEHEAAVRLPGQKPFDLIGDHLDIVDLDVAQRVSEVGGVAIVALVAHPPRAVDQLILVEGPSRTPLWEGTTYTPPENPDVIVRGDD